MDRLTILNAFGDNYIYLLEYTPGKAMVVDPGDASVVTADLKDKGLLLTHILATHHHADHIAGIDDLVRQYDCQVISSDKKRIPQTGTVVSENDIIKLNRLDVLVIETPGHTNTGICFYITSPTLLNPLLFTGDTLFVYGCGRLFECDAKTMRQSFQKLHNLPDETLVYPGHNYTQENIRFALTVSSGKTNLMNTLKTIIQKDLRHQPTVPSTLGEEKQLNPFMLAASTQQFAQLRKKKDRF